VAGLICTKIQNTCFYLKPGVVVILVSFSIIVRIPRFRVALIGNLMILRKEQRPAVEIRTFCTINLYGV
jgi:hypothetical protein